MENYKGRGEDTIWLSESWEEGGKGSGVEESTRDEGSRREGGKEGIEFH